MPFLSDSGDPPVPFELASSPPWWWFNGPTAIGSCLIVIIPGISVLEGEWYGPTELNTIVSPAVLIHDAIGNLGLLDPMPPVLWLISGMAFGTGKEAHVVYCGVSACPNIEVAVVGVNCIFTLGAVIAGCGINGWGRKVSPLFTTPLFRAALFIKELFIMVWLAEGFNGWQGFESTAFEDSMLCGGAQPPIELMDGAKPLAVVAAVVGVPDVEFDVRKGNWNRGSE